VVLAVTASRYLLILTYGELDVHVFVLCSQATTPVGRAQHLLPKQCWKLAFKPVAETLVSKDGALPQSPNTYVGVLGLFLFVLIPLHPRNNTSFLQNVQEACGAFAHEKT